MKLYPVNRDKNAEYWTKDDFKRLLSFNPDIVGAQSPRNYGKSYALMDVCRDVIDKGGCVAWGRYNKTELGQSYNTWRDFMPELDAPKKGERSSDSSVKWLVDPCTGGRIMFFPWSISQNLKGIDAPFEYMVCDEFIPERYTNKTRRDTEFADWTSVYKSLARSYGTLPVMLSNNIQWMNPFFIRWEIFPFPKGNIAVDDKRFRFTDDGETFETSRRIVFENVAGTTAIIKRNLKQQAIEFNSNDDLEQYFRNETEQEYARIGKCPDMTLPLSDFQLRSEDTVLNYRVHRGTYYWERVKDNRSLTTFVSEQAWVNAEEKRIRAPSVASEMEKLFNSGQCVFKDPTTLETFYRYIRRNRTRL